MSAGADMPDWCDACGHHHRWGDRGLPGRPTFRRRLSRVLTAPLRAVGRRLYGVAERLENLADAPARAAFELAKAQWEAREERDVYKGGGGGVVLLREGSPGSGRYG